MNTKLISRLTSTSERLIMQLNNGTKNTKEGVMPLTDKDKSRIKVEIQTISDRMDKLKAR